MKSVSVELRYPDRTVEEVRAMLADPEFRQAVCIYQHVEDSAVTIEEYDDGSMTVDLDRTYGTALVPSFARKFVGANIDLVQRAGMKVQFSTILSQMIYYVLMLGVVIFATDMLGIPAITQMVRDLVNYLPALFSAFVLFMIGLFLADMARNIATLRMLCSPAGAKRSLAPRKARGSRA